MSTVFNHDLIFVHGAYFARNFGDTLLIEFCRTLCARECPDARIVLPLAPQHAMIDFPGAPRGFSPFSRPSRVVFSGGGYFGEPPGVNARWAINCMRRHCALGLWARLRKIPYAIVGIGAGPVSSRPLRRMIRSLVDHAEFVTLRDEESLEFLVNAGAHGANLQLTTDLANDQLALNLHDAGTDSDQGNPADAWNLTVHVTGLLSRPERHIVLGGIERMLGSYPHCFVTFVHDAPWPSESRKRVADFRSNLKESFSARCSIKEYDGPAALLQNLRHSHAILTSKLHVGIVGCALNKSVLSFPTHHKTPQYYRHIGEPKRCMPSKALTKQSAWTAMDEFLRPDAPAVRLPEVIQDMAALNRNKLKRFLHDQS